MIETHGLGSSCPQVNYAKDYCRTQAFIINDPAVAKRLHPKKSLRDLRKKSAASLRQATSITVAMLCTKVKVVKPKHLKDKQANGKADKMRLKKRKMM